MKMYNECYHEMREALDIEPYDFIQDDSFFQEGTDKILAEILDYGIDDMELGRELPLDDAFTLIAELRERRL